MAFVLFHELRAAFPRLDRFDTFVQENELEFETSYRSGCIFSARKHDPWLIQPLVCPSDVVDGSVVD